MSRRAALLGLAWLAACGSVSTGGGADGGTGDATGRDDGAGAGGDGGRAAAPLGSRGILAHTPDTLYAFDPTTETLTLVGPIVWPGAGFDQLTDLAGGTFGSSGDLAWLPGQGLVGIVNQRMDPAGGTWLARVEPSTGAATVIGPTGVTDLFGIAHAGDVVYGFAPGGGRVRIDPATGVATPLSTDDVAWWGAGSRPSPRASPIARPLPEPRRPRYLCRP